MILDVLKLIQPSTTVFLLLAFLIYIVYTCLWQYVRLRHVPGPRYCRIANFALTYHEITNTRTKWIHSLHRQYGPVICISSNEIHFNTTSALKPISGINTTVAKNEFYNVYAAHGHGNMFSTIDARVRAEKRRGQAHLYSRTSLSRPDFQETLVRKIEAFRRRVSERIVRDQGILDLYLLLNCYTVDMVSALVYGEAHGTSTLKNSAKGQKNVLRVKADLRTSRNWVRIWRKAGYFTFSRTVKLSHWLLAKLDYILELYSAQETESESIGLDDYVTESGQTSIETAKTMKLDYESTLVGKLLNRGDTDLAILSESRDHIIAGSDTTTNVLAYILSYLAQNTNVRLELRSSLVEMARLPDSGVLADFSELDNSATLDAVVKEGLRLWTAIPMTLPRVTTVPMEIAGYRIPEGTNIGVQSYSLHRDPTIFLEPDTFDYTRWLVDNHKENVSDRRKRMDSQIWSFSSGSRSCIGQSLAIMELKFLIANLCSLFDFEFIGTKEDVRRGMQMDESVTSFTMTPNVKEMRMRFQNIVSQ